MGDKIKLADGLTLHAGLPAKAFCVLVRNGETIEELQNTDKIDYPVEKPGVYRLECKRRFFSNNAAGFIPTQLLSLGNLTLYYRNRLEPSNFLCQTGTHGGINYHIHIFISHWRFLSQPSH